jgi:serine/threonine-protein kinase RsbW
MSNQMETIFVIKNQIAELEKANARLEEAFITFGLPEKLLTPMNLVLEEALTNIINYAYPDNLDHSIEVGLALRDGIFSIVIQDDGVPYDPTQKADPDITKSVSDRPIGGLGIFLIRQMMDGVNYAHIDGKNVLTLSKNI